MEIDSHIHRDTCNLRWLFKFKKKEFASHGSRFVQRLVEGKRVTPTLVHSIECNLFLATIHNWHQYVLKTDDSLELYSNYNHLWISINYPNKNGILFWSIMAGKRMSHVYECVCSHSSSLQLEDVFFVLFIVCSLNDASPLLFISVYS